MSETSSPHQPTGWRTSKACQECRKRKIKCNGMEPCLTCRQRNTPCIYRDIVRRRRKKQRDKVPDLDGMSQSAEPAGSGFGARPQSPALAPKPPGKYTFHNNSVSATHMASPSCKVQLYYGPTAHFALMQQIYRDLMSNQAVQAEEPQDEVEEASAGLDLFSFRRIFFGTPSEAPDMTRNSRATGVPPIFLSYDLARTFLERFFCTLYSLMPVRPKCFFERQLDILYQPSMRDESDASYHTLVLLALAMGALGTESYPWGDVLFERAKASSAALDEVVNIQTVQISLFNYAHYQMEQGRPNSSFLHLGVGARKAIAAGLHKDVPSQDAEDFEVVKERRQTFWYFYFYETWVCFHLGRPSSLSLRDANITYPEDPFLQVLLHLSKAISRSANEIYGQRHESLLQMWKIARSIVNDLRDYDILMQRALGFGLDKPPQPGALGVRQTILIILYYHTILLTFRPFLIFRGRWQRDVKASRQGIGGSMAKRPSEIPGWLNEACANVLNSASRTIHHLYAAAYMNDLVRELRYHGFFLGSASFALIYDLIHGENASAPLLPWIHAGIWCLASMRAGDPIESSIAALQTILRKLNPSYEWVPTKQTKDHPGLDTTPSTPARPYSDYMPNGHGLSMLQTLPGEQIPDAGLPTLPDLQGNMLPGNIPIASGSVGSGEDLLDLTQSDMGWDFDFSTMDLEEFFSVHPTTGFPAM